MSAPTTTRRRARPTIWRRTSGGRGWRSNRSVSSRRITSRIGRVTKFFPLFVSDVSNETAKLYVLNASTSSHRRISEFVKQFGEPDEVRDVPTMTLSDLLDREGITTFDFLSMDIELHEPQALKGFDIERFKPALVCIEGLLPVRQQILDYLAEHGYVLVGKYMWVDREDMYFTPRGNAPARTDRPSDRPRTDESVRPGGAVVKPARARPLRQPIRAVSAALSYGPTLGTSPPQLVKRPRQVPNYVRAGYKPQRVT